jgi:hypothetical protein
VTLYVPVPLPQIQQPPSLPQGMSNSRFAGSRDRSEKPFLFCLLESKKDYSLINLSFKGVHESLRLFVADSPPAAKVITLS